VFVSALSGIFPGSQSPLWQQAILPKQEAAPEPLMIALDRPVIEISKAAVASPEQFLERPTAHPGDKHNVN
jgi:hypothetical protein